MKKLALLFTFIFMFSFTSFAKVGDVAGNIYETDIVAKIGDVIIPSYNIGGKTVIIAEEMADYGFNVVWNSENRSLQIYTGRYPENIPEKEITKSNTPGKIAGNIYETDITVHFNGMWVKSYNIGGKTAVCIEDMASNDPEKQFSRDGNAFGDTWNYAGANALWLNEKREIILNVLRPGDFPDKMSFPIKGDYIMPLDYAVTSINLKNSDGEVIEYGVVAILKDDKIFIPQKYMGTEKLTYDYATTRGSCHNNILPLEFGEKEAYFYKGEVYVDFTDSLNHQR